MQPPDWQSDDGRLRLLCGDVRKRLAELPDESVQCVVTSPPYWGLRDYGTAKWEGGDTECDHREVSIGMSDRNTLGPGGHLPATNAANVGRVRQYGGACPKCGARRIDAQLGLEATPEEYVAHMVEVFRKVRRVLRKDGTLWLNMGDSYANDGKWGGETGGKQAYLPDNDRKRVGRSKRRTGLKPKDLCGIPWRLAFALQADGWWLRSDIVWAKPNPMPESVTDRPTRSHEFVFLLSKSARYFYDAEAVREDSTTAWSNKGFSQSETSKNATRGREMARYGFGTHHDLDERQSRNRRDVWHIATQPFSGGVSYGSYRIASPDCPAHDYRVDLQRVQRCGETQGASQFVRNLGSDARPVPVQDGVAVAILVDPSAPLYDEFVAMLRSNGNCRMAFESEQGEMFFGTPAGHSEYRGLLDRSVAKFAHTRGSKTGAGSEAGETGSYPPAQTGVRIVCIQAFGRPPSKCCCHHTGRIEKRQDHFALFPEALVEPCVLAGTSERGCCPECGKPWERVLERKPSVAQRIGGEGNWIKGQHQQTGQEERAGGFYDAIAHTLGWQPGCECGTEPIPCTVLDPFAGAGTTALVALKAGRNAVLIELNPDYCAMIRERLAPVLAQPDMLVGAGG